FRSPSHPPPHPPLFPYTTLFRSQLSTRTNPTNEGDTRNFAHGMVRRIRAEVLLDVISEVTETKEKFKGLPLGSRAVQIADEPSRSEEHTSELQSRGHLVCRLLLE